MVVAAAGLLGIGAGLRAGFFGLLALTILVFASLCAVAVVQGTGLAEAVIDIGVFLAVFEGGALIGLLVRHGVFPPERLEGQAVARSRSRPAGRAAKLSS